jgi:hypothetical protein
MSINIVSSGTGYANSLSNSLAVDKPDGSSFLLISVSYLPNTAQEIQSVKFGGADAEFIEIAQQDTSIGISIWMVRDIENLSGNIEVVFDGQVFSVINYIILNGVNTDAPVYRTRSGVGKSITHIPIKSFSKINCLAIGIGSVSNPNAHISTLYGSQFRIFNVASNNLISTEAIAAFGSFDNAFINVPNSLSESSDWSIIIIGLEAA